MRTKEVSDLHKQVKEFCDEKKTNGTFKKAVNFMAKVVGRECKGRSGANGLLMTVITTLGAVGLLI